MFLSFFDHKFSHYYSRYFKRDEKSHNIRAYVYKCSRGDWFVLYQLSKNLNRPFFMDFLKELTKSVKPGHDESMERGEFFDRGDGIMEMMLKPTLATYESKDDKSKKSDDEDED